MLGGRGYLDLNRPLVITVCRDSLIKLLEIHIEVILKVVALGVRRAEKRGLEGAVHRVGRGLLIEREEVREKGVRIMHLMRFRLMVCITH